VQENYEQSIKLIGTFHTVNKISEAAIRFIGSTRTFQVESFWNIYSHMVRPDDLPNTTDYHLFKDGIKPVWEVREISLTS
jgi:hypothetical protein